VLGLNKLFLADFFRQKLRRILILHIQVYKELHQQDQNIQVDNKLHVFLSVIIDHFDIDPVPVVLLVVEGGPNTVRTGIRQHSSLKN
jgi:hypothetical protein